MINEDYFGPKDECKHMKDYIVNMIHKARLETMEGIRHMKESIGKQKLEFEAAGSVWITGLEQKILQSKDESAIERRSQEIKIETKIDEIKSRSQAII